MLRVRKARMAMRDTWLCLWGPVLLRSAVAAGAVAGLIACCGEVAPTGSSPTSAASGTFGNGTGQRLTLEGSSALEWGAGAYGVVLAHGAAFDAASWNELAVRIAAQDSTVVAVEDISAQGIVNAVNYLRDEQGLTTVALVGGSLGADAILRVTSAMPGLPDQLILLSPNVAQDGLGVSPKLFIASEGEPLVDVARELARSAAGDDNEALIIPGSAHAQNIFDTDQAEPVTQVILDRLAQFPGN